jgi:hypothetical protein
MNRLLFQIRRAGRKLRERPQRVEARRRRRVLHQRLLHHFTSRGGLTVRSGPFAGMEYLAEASWVGFFPRLPGIYEEELHGVGDRVAIGGRCRPDDLNVPIAPRTLVVSDCEGGEVELLDLDRVPALRSCIILVEIHEVGGQSVSATMRRRFEPSHRITMITSTERNPEQYAQIDGLSAEEKEFAVEEFRGRTMEWAYMEPRGSWPRQS